MQFPAVITREGKLYVAHCPDLDIASQGKTVEKALKNLKEAIELYSEDEDAGVPPKFCCEGKAINCSKNAS